MEEITKSYEIDENGFIDFHCFSCTKVFRIDTKIHEHRCPHCNSPVVTKPTEATGERTVKLKYKVTNT